MIVYKTFQKFDSYTGEADRSVVGYEVLVTFLEDWGDICRSPVTR